MDQREMTKQAFDLHRVTFYSLMGNMTMFWSQTEMALNTIMDQAVWIPEEGKKALSAWIRANKNGCEDFWRSAEDSFKKMESYLMGLQER